MVVQTDTSGIGVRALLAAAAVLACTVGAPAHGAVVPKPTIHGTLLPNPLIIGSTQAYSNDWNVGFVQDDAPNTDYASDGAADTFIDFDFGIPTAITRVIFTDRLSSGGVNGSGARGGANNVLAFRLIFSADTNFGSPDDVVADALSEPCCDTVNVDVPRGVVFRRYVRWQVTQLVGSATAPGSADIRFEGVRSRGVPVARGAALGLLAAALFAAALRALRRRA